MIGLEHVSLAFFLTFFAGLCTGIGSLIAYFIRKPKASYLSFSLGFSSGAMLYISFMELLPVALQTASRFWVVAAFFTGILFIYLIDQLIPEVENPHHFKEPSEEVETETRHLKRSGIFIAVAIGIHNFPEGLVTFVSTLNNTKIGIIVALAIAIHNVIEGITVSVPLFYATGDRNKAFLYSFLSGLIEPLGAILGFLILGPFLTPTLMAVLPAFIAGIMIYISLDEILPMAHRYGYGHLVILGVILGMLAIAISLLML